ncbi:MAG TPA: hypothetical protein DCG60_05905 [Tissierella sp.]|uniref:hypothetical protein n=1 Tax=Tissierella praeacuta TaxID=43131 RepID=UPI000ED104D0|nr:hypothetical protein [Tissierella praeacuta]HAE92167.1 hypothetical protein [Tissierella sp.]
MRFLDDIDEIVITESINKKLVYMKRGINAIEKLFELVNPINKDIGFDRIRSLLGNINFKIITIRRRY